MKLIQNALNLLWSNALWLAWIIMFGLMLLVGRWQTTTTSGCDRIVALEFAHNPDEALRLARDTTLEGYCDCPGISEKIQHNTLYDILLIFSYTAVIILSFYILWINLSHRRIPVIWWILMVLPGMCDLAEDNFIFQFTSGVALPQQFGFDPYFFVLYYVVVRVKWALAIMFTIIVLAVLLYLLLLFINGLFKWTSIFSIGKKNALH